MVEVGTDLAAGVSIYQEFDVKFSEAIRKETMVDFDGYQWTGRVSIDGADAVQAGLCRFYPDYPIGRWSIDVILNGSPCGAGCLNYSDVTSPTAGTHPPSGTSFEFHVFEPGGEIAYTTSQSSGRSKRLGALALAHPARPTAS